MDIKLSTGFIRDVHTNVSTPETLTLQVIAAKMFPNGDRSRLLISDGVHSSGFAILASQLSHMVEKGELEKNTVIKVNRYFCNDVQATNKKMMIILDLEVLKKGSEMSGLIGDPTTYTVGATAAQATARPSAPSSNSRSPLVSRNGPITSTPSVTKPLVGSSPKAPEGMANVRKIDSLTPYQNKWTICARVTVKTPIRTWSKATGEGKLFSVNLLDDSGEIRATAFNQECDRFYDLMEVNSVFYITSAQLKTANKQYSNLDNDYEMTFNSNTQVVRCVEEVAIPSMQYNFVSFDQMEKLEKDSVIDLIAIVKEANELSTVVQKRTGKELTKRDVVLVDNTNRSVNITMWGDQAQNFDGTGNPVIAVKGAKVSDFGGVSLSLIMASSLTVNPDISEAHQLKGWWEQTGSSMSDIVNMSNNRGGQGSASMQLKTFEEVKREGLGNGDNADYFSVKANVLLIRKENLMYMACPSEGCNKKVTDMSNGMYRCEKCNREFDRYNWRLMVQCNLGDATSNQWATLFQDTAETLLGITAQDLATKREESPDEFTNYIFKRSFSEFIFKCRVKMETFNDERRLKTTVAQIHPMNYKEYNKKLIADIKAMAGQ